jgi:hypothetical protein
MISRRSLMQKRTSAVFLAIVAVLIGLAACGPKTQTTAAAGGKAPETVSADANTGFVIYNKAYLFVEKDGALAYKETFTLGEKVAVLGESQKKKDPYSKTDKDFIPVRAESGDSKNPREGWARSDYVVPNSVLGVIVAEEALIYSQPKNESATTETLPILTILAVSADFDSQNFVKVTAVNPANSYLKKDIYLRKEAISTSAADPACAILLILAQKSTVAKQRDEMLNNAKTDYPGSVFAPLVTQYLNATTLPDAGKATEAYDAVFIVNDNDVNVRSLPDETFGAIVTTLKKEQTVQSEKRTTETYTIGDATERWYKIKTPAGWVYGKFLQEQGGEEPADAGASEG